MFSYCNIRLDENYTIIQTTSLNVYVTVFKFAGKTPTKTLQKKKHKRSTVPANVNVIQ